MPSLSKMNPDYEAAKLPIDEPAKLMNEVDLRELCNRICPARSNDAVARNLAQRFGLQRNYEQTRHESDQIFTLLSIWIRRQGSTIRALIRILEDMDLPDCVEFIDNTARYRFVKLLVILHIPSVSEPFPVNADQVPSRLPLEQFVRSSDIVQDQMMHISNGYLCSFTIKLNRLENLSWDSPSVDYVGRQIDLYLYQDVRESSSDLALGYCDGSSNPRGAVAFNSSHVQSPSDDKDGVSSLASLMKSTLINLSLHSDDSIPNHRPPQPCTDGRNQVSATANEARSIQRGTAVFNSSHVQSPSDDKEAHTPAAESSRSASFDRESRQAASTKSASFNISLHSEDLIPNQRLPQPCTDGRNQQVSATASGARLNFTSVLDRDTMETGATRPTSTQAEIDPYTYSGNLGPPTREKSELHEVSQLPGFHKYLHIPDSQLRDEAKKDIQLYYNKNRRDGCYLIRRSQNKMQRFTLTFGHSDMIHHISIIKVNELKYALFEQPNVHFDSVKELIEYYKNNDIRKGVRLTVPVT